MLVHIVSLSPYPCRSVNKNASSLSLSLTFDMSPARAALTSDWFKTSTQWLKSSILADTLATAVDTASCVRVIGGGRAGSAKREREANAFNLSETNMDVCKDRLKSPDWETTMNKAMGTRNGVWSE